MFDTIHELFSPKTIFINKIYGIDLPTSKLAHIFNVIMKNINTVITIKQSLYHDVIELKDVFFSYQT